MGFSVHKRTVFYSPESFFKKNRARRVAFFVLVKFIYTNTNKRA